MYRSLVSYVIILWFSFMLSFVMSSARLMEFFTFNWWSMFRYPFSLCTKYLDTLCGGALMLLITGLIGLPSLCILIWAFSFGGWGFFCINL